MSVIYNYFYIGEQTEARHCIFGSTPTMLTCRKVQGELRQNAAMHSHNLLEVFYFLSGKGRIEFKNRSYDILPNTVLVVNANNMHRQFGISEDDLPVYINFFVDNFSIKGHPVGALSDGLCEMHYFHDSDNVIYRLSTSIMDELLEKKTGCYQKANAMFIELMVEILRLFEMSGPADVMNGDKVSRAIGEIKDYIDRNYSEKITLADLASRAYFTKEYFSKRFRAAFGMPPMQYLSNVRIESAKTMLGKTDIPITEIALAVGIDNPSYFAELFKKTVGLSPSRYRKVFTLDI